MKALDPSIYPAVFFRKSTRRYGDSLLTQERLDQLEAFLGGAVPLFPGEQAAFEVQPHKGGTMKIAAYAQPEAASLMNLAFLLQQMDFWLQSQGLGALWNATLRATKKQHQGLPYQICLVFGVAGQSPTRASLGEFRRKPQQELSNRPELPLVSAVRLAPSARNRQPWYLSYQEDREDRIDFYCKKGGLLDQTLLKNLHWIDMGIAACPAVLALQQEGLSPAAAIRPDAPEKDGYRYALTLHAQTSPAL